MPFLRGTRYAVEAAGGASAPQSPLRTALVSWYDLDDASDKHSTNHLTNTNTVTFVSDGLGVGNVANLVAASSQSLNLAAGAASSVFGVYGVDWSVAFWASRETTAGMVFAQLFNGSGNIPWYVEYNGTQFRVRAQADTGAPVAAKTVTSPVGTFRCVVATYAYSTRVLSIYVNGSSSPGTATGSADLMNLTGSQFFIGRDLYAGWGYATCRIGSFAFWSSAPGGGGCLSTTLVDTYYNNGTRLVYSNLG